MRVELLVIDPQIDFCDPHKGALYVGGAEKDIERLARMVRRIAPKLSDIHVTLDSHHYVDIAHPIFWIDSKGGHPNPFTIITAADVENGRWTTTQPGMYRRALEYVKSLETGGRYALCIWPYHCLIGSAGHAVMPELFAALQEWEQRFAVVDYVTKGSNIYTEHYSAIQAEVPDPTDPSTQINTALIQTLMQADLIAIAGEAGSHCLANTVRDLANNFGGPAEIKKLVLLTDATSPVTGFEPYQTDFVRDMTVRGMQLSTTTEFLA
jgi:nicotinamidase-related amidase